VGRVKFAVKEIRYKDQMEDTKPEPEREESSSDDRSRSDSAKNPGKRDKKSKKKKSRKGKEPIRPKGFDKFMSPTSRAGGSNTRNPAAEVLGNISVRHDTRNVPSGVHFNKNKGKSDGGNKQSKGKHGRKSKKEESRTMRPTVRKHSKRQRKRAASTSSSSSSSVSSSSLDSSSSTSSDSSSTDSSSSTSSTSSSSSSSPSDSSEDDNRRSSSYTGKADLDVFDRWTFEVTTWKRLNRLSDEIAITMLNKYVIDKAGVFYMKYVAGKAKEWTLTDVGD